MMKSKLRYKKRLLVANMIHLSLDEVLRHLTKETNRRIRFMIRGRMYLGYYRYILDGVEDGLITCDDIIMDYVHNIIYNQWPILHKTCIGLSYAISELKKLDGMERDFAMKFEPKYLKYYKNIKD